MIEKETDFPRKRKKESKLNKLKLKWKTTEKKPTKNERKCIKLVCLIWN